MIFNEMDLAFRDIQKNLANKGESDDFKLTF